MLSGKYAASCQFGADFYILCVLPRYLEAEIRALGQHSTPSKSMQDYQINHSLFTRNFKQMVNISILE